MSSRNLFIINKTDYKEYIDLKEKLSRIALARKIGIHFNVQCYQDEILKLLKIKDFFCISDSFDNIETDSLFSTNDSFEAVKNLNLTAKKLKEKEKEFLQKKYAFLNEVIEAIFMYLPDIDSVHFYVSNQYCIELTDYSDVIVKNKDLAKAFVESFEPTKNDNYFGLKTTKFVIKK